jgi:ribonuclease P protein subunit POP4
MEETSLARPGTYESKLQDKVLLLDNPRPEKSFEKIHEEVLAYIADEIILQKIAKKLKNRQVLSSKEKRETKMFAIPKENQKYEMFLPLHNLWNQYIDDLVAKAT